MAGSAMMQSRLTEEPTMPVAAAKIVPVRLTVAKSEPGSLDRRSWNERNSRVMSPAPSRR